MDEKTRPILFVARGESGSHHFRGGKETSTEEDRANGSAGGEEKWRKSVSATVLLRTGEFLPVVDGAKGRTPNGGNGARARPTNCLYFAETTPTRGGVG